MLNRQEGFMPSGKVLCQAFFCAVAYDKEGDKEKEDKEPEPDRG